MKKAAIALILTAILPLIAGASVTVTPEQAGSQYLAYPVDDATAPQLTPVPEGYEAFHMEHYGRHGSRWLLNDRKYDSPVDRLQRADSAGALTPKGKQLLARLTDIRDSSRGRVGELTPLGHRQHRGIARRMSRNFPTLFVPGTHLDAKSTVVIRCILSMANEVAELQMLHPYIDVTMDASRTTQPILAYNSTDTVAKRLAREADTYADEYADRIADHSAFINKVYIDPQFARDSLQADKLFGDVFDVAVNVQSHDDQESLFGYFTPAELQNEWLGNNASWYISSGSNPMTGGRVPFNQRVLLDNIISSADTAMTSASRSVNLRFGHESILLPLSVMMELNSAAHWTDNLDSLADVWRNYEIFPMGSNIQVVFFRPRNNPSLSPDEVIVKVLLNEAEATLPVAPAPQGAPYYRWADLRSFWQGKLDTFSSRFKE